MVAWASLTLALAEPDGPAGVAVGSVIIRSGRLDGSGDEGAPGVPMLGMHGGGVGGAQNSGGPSSLGLTDLSITSPQGFFSLEKKNLSLSRSLGAGTVRGPCHPGK